MSSPRWRIAIGLVVLAALALFSVNLVPLYWRNYRLQEFVSATTQRVSMRTAADDAVREAVLDQAASLGLPVKAADVHIAHPEGGLRIDVRYVVRVDLPGYTVLLHFYPGAGN